MPRPDPIDPALISEISSLGTAKGWRKNLPADPRDNAEPGADYAFLAYLAFAHSELSEALDAYRDGTWSGTRSDGKPVGVGPELADTLIRVLDICSIWGIDINEELRRVLDYAWTRSWPGGRRL